MTFSTLSLSARCACGSRALLIRWKDGRTTPTCADSIALYRARYGEPSFLVEEVPINADAAR
jgi:hypothetical protein